MKYGAAVNVYDEVHFISLSDPQHKRNLLQQATLKDNLPVLDFLYTYPNINVNLLDSVSLLIISLTPSSATRASTSQPSRASVAALPTSSTTAL